jgi:hypothetical protein
MVIIIVHIRDQVYPCHQVLTLNVERQLKQIAVPCCAWTIGGALVVAIFAPAVPGHVDPRFQPTLHSNSDYT